MRSVAPPAARRPARRTAGRARGVVLAALVLALLGLVALVPSGAPADAAVRRASAACTVKPWDKASVVKAADGADAVLVARVTKAVRTAGPAAANLKHPAQWAYTIRIVTTFRGSAQPGISAALTQVPVKRRLGTPLVKRATYLFFLHQAGAGFTADRCGGSVLLRNGLSKNLRSKLTADIIGISAPGAQVVYTQPKGGVRAVPSLGRLAGPGIGLALIGVLGLLLVGRVAREKAER